MTICQATGNLNVGTAINTTGTVRLATTDGNITQTAGITAAALGAVANGAATSAILLDTATNDVSTFSGQAQAALRYTDVNTFSVRVSANICFPGSDGPARLLPEISC